jgi:hypothetical protein
MARAVLGILILIGCQLTLARASAGVPNQCPTQPGWTRLAIPVAPRGVAAVAAGWTSQGELYVGTFDGLYWSSDCAGSWESRLSVSSTEPQRLSRAVPAVAVGPEGGIYIGGSSDPISVSHDDGRTWQVARFVNPDGTLGPFASSSSLAASQRSPLLVFAETHSANLRGASGFAASEDGGLTWSLQSRRVVGGPIAADTRDSDTVYLGQSSCVGGTANCSGQGVLYKSVDRGASIVALAEFPSGVTAMHVSGDPPVFWLATRDGSIFRSIDRGHNWDAIAVSPSGTAIVSLSASPHDPTLMFAVTQDEQLWAYRWSGPVLAD